MRLTILGFGLIGGSIARALRAPATRGAWRVTAWSRNLEPVRRAANDGVVQIVGPTLQQALHGAELVVLAAPPLACLDLLRRMGPGGDVHAALDPAATVTDVASAKTRIVALADELRLPFIGGHPMAGREVTGYGSALPDLFAGRPWVVVPGRCARLVDGERLGSLVDACGAYQVPMGAAQHDEAVAAISHLPLVVSTALAEAVIGGADDPQRGDWMAAAALAATGWAGMTRLAKGDPAMGAGIAATNAAAIARRLRDLQQVLGEWLAELERPGGADPAALQHRFEEARAKLLEAAPQIAEQRETAASPEPGPGARGGARHGGGPRDPGGSAPGDRR